MPCGTPRESAISGSAVRAGARVAVAALELTARATRTRIVPSDPGETVVRSGIAAMFHLTRSVHAWRAVLQLTRPLRWSEPCGHGRPRCAGLSAVPAPRGGGLPASPGHARLGSVPAAAGGRGLCAASSGTRLSRRATARGGRTPGRCGWCLARDNRPAAGRTGRLRAFGRSFLHDRVLLYLHLEVEQVADRLLLDPVHHRAEHVEALALVLDQRVALRHRPQSDAPTQVVHLVQVLSPLAVQHRQHHPALELA